MAQFTFADDDDASTPPAAPPPPKPEPEPAPSAGAAAPAAKPAGAFTLAEEDTPAPPPTPPKAAPPTPAAPPPPAPVAATPAAPQAPRPVAPPASTSASAPRVNPIPPPGSNPIPPPPGTPRRAAPASTSAPAPQAPAARPATPQAPASAGGAPVTLPVASAAATDNPVRDAAQAAAKAPDHGASAGMVGGAIPNVAGPRPPSPPLPNQASNAPGAASTSAPAPPRPPGAPTAPTPPTAGIPHGATRAPVAPPSPYAPPPAPVVHAATPGMATITPDVVREVGPDWRAQLAKADPFFSWLFRISAIVAVLSGAYILFALFNGAATQPQAGADPKIAQRAAQFANDLGVAGKAFQWSLLLAALSALLLAFDIGWIGPALAAIGFALHFGAPAGLRAMGLTPATATLGATLRATGLVLLVIGLLKYSVDFVRWLQELPNRVKSKATVGSAHKAEAKQQILARTATMFSPCWHLPYCREVIRLQCPAFLARQRCWKFGRGCYCDEEMIGRIIRGESLDKIKAPTRMSTQKPPCGRCHIFLEHQGLKYKMFAPLAVPATAGIMFVLWSPFSRLFTAASLRLSGVWDSVNIGVEATGSLASKEKAATDSASYLSAEKTAEYGLWVFGILLGFFLLIYISKAIEWAILQAKL